MLGALGLQRTDDIHPLHPNCSGKKPLGTRSMGEEGLEPSRLAAHDPKSCSSASSDTRPGKKIGLLFLIMNARSAAGRYLLRLFYHDSWTPSKISSQTPPSSSSGPHSLVSRHTPHRHLSGYDIVLCPPAKFDTSSGKSSQGIKSGGDLIIHTFKR
jgi:hypothetical protein